MNNDAAGRAVASINALSYRTTNVYNAASQGVGAITALGQRMTQVYDSAGRGVASITPSGIRNTSIYDTAGRNAQVAGHPVASASRPYVSGETGDTQPNLLHGVATNSRQAVCAATMPSRGTT